MKFFYIFHLLTLFGIVYSGNQWSGTLTSVHKQIILNSHNWLRNALATQTVGVGPKLPFSANMLQMYWDEGIAMRAQDWANKCQFSQSPEYLRTLQSFTTGENIGMHKSQDHEEMDWEKMIGEWFLEINNFKGNVGNYQGSRNEISPTYHFTQIAWANSYLIGCGFSYFEKNREHINLYVCHYGPRGNLIGLPIYTGFTEPKAMCLSGTDKKNKFFPGLCCPMSQCEWSTQKYDGPLIYGTQPLNPAKISGNLR